MTTSIDFAFFEAMTGGDTQQVRVLLKEHPTLLHTTTPTHLSPVLLATYYGQHAIIDVLTEHGAQFDIFAAAATGNTDHVSRLLMVEPKLVRNFTPDGWTALHLASYFGHHAVVDKLLAAGAYVNTASRNAQQVMPLHTAVAAHQLQIAKALIEYGADVNAAQAGGWTPLHTAAQHGQELIVQLLLNAGANLHARQAAGHTALSLARRHGHKLVIALLQQSGKVS